MPKPRRENLREAPIIDIGGEKNAAANDHSAQKRADGKPALGKPEPNAAHTSRRKGKTAKAPKAESKESLIKPN